MSQPNRSTRATIKRTLSVDDFNIIPQSVSTDQLLGDTLLSDSTTRVVVNSKRRRQQKQQKQMNSLSQSQSQHDAANATIQKHAGNMNDAGK